MIVSQNEIRSRIEQLRLNYEGYRRQLSRLDLSGERRERLERDVQLLDNEIATLEKIAQVGRVEPDRARIEEIVRERLAVVHERFASDPATAHLTSQEHEAISGETRALMWTLREDTLTRPRYSRTLCGTAPTSKHAPAPPTTWASCTWPRPSPRWPTPWPTTPWSPRWRSARWPASRTTS